jgi:hypothetical protein
MFLFIEAVRNSALLLPSLKGIYVRISDERGSNGRRRNGSSRDYRVRARRLVNRCAKSVPLPRIPRHWRLLHLWLFGADTTAGSSSQLPGLFFCLQDQVFLRLPGRWGWQCTQIEYNPAACGVPCLLHSRPPWPRPATWVGTGSKAW